MAKRRAVLLTVEGSPPDRRSCHERGEHARRRLPHPSVSGRVEPADGISHRLARWAWFYRAPTRQRRDEPRARLKGPDKPVVGRQELTSFKLGSLGVRRAADQLPADHGPNGLVCRGWTGLCADAGWASGRWLHRVAGRSELLRQVALRRRVSLVSRPTPSAWRAFARRRSWAGS